MAAEGTALGQLCAGLQQSLPNHPAELPTSLAGSRAAAEGAEQGPDPRGLGGGPGAS